MSAQPARRTLAEHIGRAQFVIYALAVALATVGASIVGYHYLHQRTLRHLHDLAQITAIEAQPALIFGDDAAAADVLHAIPREEGVTQAELHDAKGALRARALDPPQGIAGYIIGLVGDEEAAATVTADGRGIGEVRLKGGLEPMLGAFFGLILSDILVLTCVGVLSYIVSRRNTRHVTRPLTQLRTIMQRAMQQRDFTQRAPAAEIAEVDDLRTEFNALLDEVVRRDQALRANNQVLRRMAFHDVLTGLPNRAMFESALTATLNECAATRTKAALLYLDVDSFKAVNDTFGHDAGDNLLTTIAGRLRTGLPEGSLPARLGGDEFVVLISPVGGRNKLGVDPTVRVLRELLEKPVEINGHTVTPGVSIGVAVYPDTAQEADALMQAADKAMYEVKGAHYQKATVTRWKPAGPKRGIAPDTTAR